MEKFTLKSPHEPAGDQPRAIKELIAGLEVKDLHQVLLGATGTGKTFTIANVIAKTNRTTIILSHNKTLAAQLYAEMKGLFPTNRVEYFISNFDYYRPEAYLPSSDTFIDKTSKSNWDIEAMRMSAVNALSLGEPTIVIASVASIYSLVTPSEFVKQLLPIKVGMKLKRSDLLVYLVQRQYERNNIDLKPGTFKVLGEVVEVMSSYYKDLFYRIEINDDIVASIKEINYLSKNVHKTYQTITILPAELYSTRPETLQEALKTIRFELENRLDFFRKEGKLLEAERLSQRTRADLDSLSEFGVVKGVENYSRHFDKRAPGERPYTILDYIVLNSSIRKAEPLFVIDESHMMIPQLNAMYNGDRSRKEALVEYGFRLPSALDNRPLKFAEFESAYKEVPKIYVSATPSEYEVNLANGVVVSQIVRPTGLLDPTIEIVPTTGQTEHIYDQIQHQKAKKARTFILTITKKMAEELTRYLQERKEKVAYIHSDHKTFERDEILRKLRLGIFDTVIGVNLIREGIDVPEISLVLVLDADKESFFRSKTSLIQIIGRAARNVSGHVVLYGDRVTQSMREAIDETARRRAIQDKHNKEHNIEPRTIVKSIPEPLNPEVANKKEKDFEKMSKAELKKLIEVQRGKMLYAARELDFERAAQLRDYILELETML